MLIDFRDRRRERDINRLPSCMRPNRWSNVQLTQELTHISVCGRCSNQPSHVGLGCNISWKMNVRAPAFSLIANHFHMLNILFLSRALSNMYIFISVISLTVPRDNWYPLALSFSVAPYLFSVSRTGSLQTTFPRLPFLLLPVSFCRWEALAGDWKVGVKVNNYFPSKCWHVSSCATAASVSQWS